jgi:preprotein translocase subunit SecG
MLNPVLTILQIVILLLVAGIVGITLALNVKSEGLGAAITGASDTYRGAVGVEEQKRRLLSQLCYAFVAISFIFAILQTWL